MSQGKHRPKEAETRLALTYDFKKLEGLFVRFADLGADRSTRKNGLKADVGGGAASP